LPTYTGNDGYVIEYIVPRIYGFANKGHVVTIFAGEGKATSVDIVGDLSAVLVEVSGLGSGGRRSLKGVDSSPTYASEPMNHNH